MNALLSPSADEREDEVAALRAIYGEQCVQDVRSEDAWRVPRPPELRVHLSPSVGDSHGDGRPYASVTLWVKCGDKYPNEAPLIALENECGFSKSDSAALVDILTSNAQQALGQVMIMELCQTVLDFLHDRNRPPEYQSFFEGMHKRMCTETQKLHIDEQARREASVTLEAEAITEELELRQRRRCSRSGSHGRQKEKMQSVNVIQDANLPTNSNAISIRLSNGAERRLLPQPDAIGLRASHQFLHEFFATDLADPSSYYLVTECNFPTPTTNIKRGACSRPPDTVYRKVAAIEKEFLSLCKLRLGEGVGKYIALDLKRDATADTTAWPTKITLVQNLGRFQSPPSNLAQLISLRRNLPPSQRLHLTHFTLRQVLDALVEIHARDVLHKTLNVDCVWLDVERDVCVVSDHSLRHRVHEICEEYDIFLKSQAAGVRASAQNPKADVGVQLDLTAPGAGKPSRRTDIYMATLCGLCVFSDKLSTDANELLAATSGCKRLHEFCVRALNREFTDAAEARAHVWLQSKLEDGVALANPVADDDHKPSIAVSLDASLNPVPQHSEPAADTLARTRFTDEFVTYETLGRGAYGDVLKVRNKLDSCLYAVKRVPLETTSRKLLRKITREVKLLSRLNHENVVRYYNSWIEEVKPGEVGRSTSDSNADAGASDIKGDTGAVLVDGSGQKVPSTKQTERTSSSSSSSVDSNADSDSESDWSIEGGLDAHGFSLAAVAPEVSIGFSLRSLRRPQVEHSTQSTSAQGITFEDSERKSGEQAPAAPAQLWTDGAGTRSRKRQGQHSGGCSVGRVLFIQMELCEKSTLRLAIDRQELLVDSSRPWRLFYEILNGLKYIHSLGMVHRDIKPVNIFLDFHDHVKIGDFGLATSEAMHAVRNAADDGHSRLEETSKAEGQTQLTTHVGTALYVAPELCNVATQYPDMSMLHKVDMYSAGVVLFEIFYRPLPLGMDRVHTLTAIRQAEPQLPGDWPACALDKKSAKKLKLLLDSLLTHNVLQRLSADAVLKSDLLPPLEKHAGQFQVSVRTTLANERSTQFRWLMDTVLDRNANPAVDYCFDLGLCQAAGDATSLAVARGCVERVFRRHAACHIDGPLLMPKSCGWSAPNAAEYVDASGTPVVLRYDLRVGYARLLARQQIVSHRRYAFGTACRAAEIKHAGEHPRISAEAAFDVLTAATCGPVEAAASVAELIAVVDEVLSAVDERSQERVCLQLNHFGLLRAVLAHNGVADHRMQTAVLRWLADSRQADLLGPPVSAASATGQQAVSESVVEVFRASMAQSDVHLSEGTAAALLNMLAMDASVNQVSSQLRCITKRKTATQVANEAKRALSDLEKLVESLVAFGVKMGNPRIRLRLVVRPDCYGIDPNQDRFVFRCVLLEERGKKKKQTQMVAFAYGGCYSGLIRRHRKSNMDPAEPVAGFSACGVSLSLDVAAACLIRAASREEERSELDSRNDAHDMGAELGSAQLRHSLRPCDILLAPIDGMGVVLQREMCADAAALWAAGIRAEILYEKLADAHDAFIASPPQLLVERRGAAGLVAYQSSVCAAGCRLLVTVAETGRRYAEKRIEKQDLLQALLPAVFGEDGAPAATTSGSALTSKLQSGVAPSESTAPSAGTMRNVNMHFLFDEKLERNSRRRVEMQIASALEHTVRKLSAKTIVEVIACDVNIDVLRQLAILVAPKCRPPSLPAAAALAAFDQQSAATCSQAGRVRGITRRLVEQIRAIAFGNAAASPLCDPLAGVVLVLFSCASDAWVLVA